MDKCRRGAEGVKGNKRKPDKVAVGFSSYDGDLRLPLVLAPGKPNLPLDLRGEAGGCARVTAGPKRPHLVVCPGPNIPLKGRQGSRGCIPDSPGVTCFFLHKESNIPNAMHYCLTILVF